MKTTTIRLTQQEFETVVFALRLYQDAERKQVKRDLMLKWYQCNEEFDLLDSGLLNALIEKINTSNFSSRCITCGWDASRAFNSTSNCYCDECAEFRVGAPPKPEVKPKLSPS